VGFGASRASAFFPLFMRVVGMVLISEDWSVVWTKRFLRYWYPLREHRYLFISSSRVFSPTRRIYVFRALPTTSRKATRLFRWHTAYAPMTRSLHPYPCDQRITSPPCDEKRSLQLDRPRKSAGDGAIRHLQSTDEPPRSANTGRDRRFLVQLSCCCSSRTLQHNG